MQHQPMQTWTAEEARHYFLAATADQRLEALWALMVSTGLRRGESMGLRWADVDLNDGRLSVVQTVVVASNQVYLSEPKTSAGRRSVSLYPDVVAPLRRHQVWQDHERNLAATAWQGDGMVRQPTVDFNRLSRDNLIRGNARRAVPGTVIACRGDRGGR